MSSLDLFQQFQIEQARHKASEIKDEIRDRKRKTQTIEERLDKISLVTQAVWSFLKETHHLQDADLLNRIEQIDLKDGV